MCDYWAHRFVDDPRLRNSEMHNPDFEADLAAAEAELQAEQAGQHGPVPPHVDDWEDVP